MKKDLKIVVVYGGISTEREISLHSGQAVFEALKEYGFTDVTLFDLHHDNIGGREPRAAWQGWRGWLYPGRAGACRDSVHRSGCRCECRRHGQDLYEKYAEGGGAPDVRVYRGA